MKHLFCIDVFSNAQILSQYRHANHHPQHVLHSQLLIAPMAAHSHTPSMVGSLCNVGGIIFPKPEDPPDPSLARSGLTPAQAYQAQINLHSISPRPPLLQNGHSHVSIDDVPCIGMQIKPDLNINFGSDNHPESQRISPTIHQASCHGLNIRLIIHMGLLAKCPYLGDMLYTDILSSNSHCRPTAPSAQSAPPVLGSSFIPSATVTAPSFPRLPTPTRYDCHCRTRPTVTPALRPVHPRLATHTSFADYTEGVELVNSVLDVVRKVLKTPTAFKVDGHQWRQHFSNL